MHLFSVIFSECGRSHMRDSKIVGGEDANFGEQPWQVRTSCQCTSFDPSFLSTTFISLRIPIILL